MSVRFKATVYQRGASARVDVPEKITAAFGETGYIAVSGTLNGSGIRATLMPAGGGRHVLNINVAMRKRAGISVGDSVTLTLDRGEATRQPPMSHELAQALSGNADAKATWEGATPAKRKAVLARLAKQRTQEAVMREVARVIEGLGKGRI